MASNIQYTKDEAKASVEGHDFKYWFKLRPDGKYEVTDLDNPKEPELILTEDEIGMTYAESDFNQFKCRPEYTINHVTSDDLIIPIMTYDKLLVGASLIRARSQGVDQNVALDHTYKILEWLHSTDFFEAPASCYHHESYPSGLVEHTLKVVKDIVDLMKADKFKDVEVHSAILVALMHDWCKIGLYESYNRNVKDEKTGQWNQVVAYRHKEDAMTCFGHGVSSMFLAQRFFKLTTDEALAIRWHMGEYNAAENEYNELHQANRNCPLCYLIQFADRLACTGY